MKVAINKKTGILVCEAFDDVSAINTAKEREYPESDIEVRDVNEKEYFDLQLARNLFSPTGKVELIQARIDSLERQALMPRITREALLETFITLAAAQGITEPQLYAVNIGYRKTKDFDAQITILRTLL